MRISKIYVVCSGRQRGIFDQWSECWESVGYYSAAKYKSFTDPDEALYYIRKEMKQGGPYNWSLGGEKRVYQNLTEFFFDIDSYYDDLPSTDAELVPSWNPIEAYEIPEYNHYISPIYFIQEE